MSSVRLQFVLGSGLSSHAIAWFGGGEFSHVDYVAEDGLIGARSDAIKGIPPGVQIRPFNYEKWDRKVQVEIRCTEGQRADFDSLIRTRIPQPYDKLAIYGFFIGRDWKENGRWICSELQADCLEETKIIPRLYMSVNRITPGALLLALSAAGGEVVKPAV